MTGPYSNSRGPTAHACALVTALTLAAVLVVVDTWLVASITLHLWGLV